MSKKVCTPVYIGRDGKPSLVYTQNLHLGEDVAKRLYTQDMASVATAKFQKANYTIEDLIEESNELVVSTDEESYILKKQALNRATNFLGKAQAAKEMAEFAADKAVKDYAYILLENDMDIKNPEDRLYKDLILKKTFVDGIKDKTFSLNKHGDLKDKLMLAAQEYMDNNPDDFEVRKQNLLDLWEFKTEAGTKIHKVIEDYVNFRSKVEPDKDGLYDYKSAAEAAMLVNDMKKDSHYLSLTDQMEAFFEKLEGTGANKKNLKYHTEVKVSDTDIGVAGTLDLLVEDEEGNLYIFDYKTKEKGKEHLFAWKDKRLMGAMSELYDNKETHGALQTSLYRLILEKKGFTVKESKIIYIEADVKYDKNGKVIDYYNFNHLKNVTLRNYRSVLGKFIKESNNYDIDNAINSLKEKGKFNDIKDIATDLTGLESLDDQRDVPGKIRDKMNGPLVIGKKSGKEGFWNELLARHVDYKSEDPEARKTQLEEYYMQAPRLAADTTNSVIDWFKDGKIGEVGKGKNSRSKTYRTTQAQKLLQGIEADTHTLEQVNNIHGFSHLPPNILIAVDEATNSATIINLTVKGDSFIKDENSTTKRPRTSIFSKYVADSTLKTKYDKVDFLESTDNNHRLFQSALIAAELKKRGYLSTVDALVVGEVNGYENNSNTVSDPKTSDMHAMASQIKIFSELVKDNDAYGAYMMDIITDKKLLKAESYDTDYIGRISAALDNGLGSMTKKNKDKIKKYFKDYDNGAGSLQMNDLIDKLVDIHYTLGKTLQGKTGSEDIKELAKDRSYEFMSRLILDLMDVRLNIGAASRKLSTAFAGKVRTIGKVSNDAVEYVSNSVNESEQYIKRDFEKFRAQHSLVLNKLRDYKGKNRAAAIRDEQDIFTNLYKEGGHPDAETVNNRDLFMLKDENDPTLHETEAAYIKFFNKYIHKGYEMISNEEELVKLNDKDESNLMTGMVPLVRASLQNKYNRTEGMKEKIAGYKKSLKEKAEKRMTQDFAALNAELKDNFSNQLGSKEFQGSRQRREKLGINSSGDLIQEGETTYKGLETNLQQVLHTFMKDSLRSKHYKSTLGLYNSLNVVMAIDESRYFNQNEKTREFAEQIVKFQVFGEHAQEGKTAKRVDRVQKVLTAAALGASIRQVLLEGSTNLFGSGSAVIQQAITKNGEEKRFTVKNWHRAMKASIQSGHQDGNKANMLTRDLGLFNADSETLASSELQETKRNGIFQSKWLYALNNLPYRFFKTNTVISTMMTNGSYDAYEFDTDTNLLTYNASNDKRFNLIFDNNGKLIKDKSSFTPEQSKQFAYLKRRIQDFSKEYEGLKKGGEQIEIDGINHFLPDRGVTVKELADMKDYSMRLYGSMDKESKPVGAAYSLGRVFLKFKTWAVAKKDNYWKDGKFHEQRGYYKWFADDTMEDGGYYEWEPDYDEGVIQTLTHLGRGLKEAFGKDNDVTMKALWSDMGRKQKENIRKVISDIIMIGLIWGLMAALFDDDDKEKGPMSLLYKATNSALADLNVLQMSDSMMGNSPIAMYGQATTTLGCVWNGIGYMLTGDFSNGTDQFIRTTGAGKSMKALGE